MVRDGASTEPCRPDTPRHSTAINEEKGSGSERPNHWYSSLLGLRDVERKPVGSDLYQQRYYRVVIRDAGHPDTNRHCHVIDSYISICQIIVINIDKDSYI